MATISQMLIYSSPVSEFITCKLSLFYNKIILGQNTRCIIMVPNDMDTFRAGRHKIIPDEVVIAKFDPTKAQFWQTRRLSAYYYFMMSNTDIDGTNIYLDQGKIVHFLPTIPNANIVSLISDTPNTDMLVEINQVLADSCEFNKLDPSDLKMFNFSMFVISDEAKQLLQKPMKKVLQNYPVYIDEQTAYGIMSWFTCLLVKQNSITHESISAEVININGSPLIEDFYTLI